MVVAQAGKGSSLGRRKRESERDDECPNVRLASSPHTLSSSLCSRRIGMRKCDWLRKNDVSHELCTGHHSRRRFRPPSKNDDDDEAHHSHVVAKDYAAGFQTTRSSPCRLSHHTTSQQTATTTPPKKLSPNGVVPEAASLLLLIEAARIIDLIFNSFSFENDSSFPSWFAFHLRYIHRK